MRIYATTANLADWTGETAPDDAGALLRSASLLVEGATSMAVYATTASGLPTPGPVADAMQDATCSQAAYWAANGLHPQAGPLAVHTERVAASKSIKGASVSYDTAAAKEGRTAKADALTTLAHEPLTILANAGLLRGTPL